MATSPRCPTCDHNVSGVTSMVCPECGSEFVWLPVGSKAPLPKSKRRRLFHISLIILFLTIVGSAGVAYLQVSSAWWVRRGGFDDLLGAMLLSAWFGVFLVLTIGIPLTAGAVVFIVLATRAALRNRKLVWLAIVSYIVAAVYILIAAYIASGVAAAFD